MLTILKSVFSLMIEAHGLAVLLNFSQVSRLCCALTAHGSCVRGFVANLEFSQSSVFDHRVMDSFDLIDYISVGFTFLSFVRFV